MSDNATDNLLKPCPHCGGPAQWEDDGRGGTRVACQVCYAGEFLTDEAEAVAVWEQRPAVALTQEQRDVLTVWEWIKGRGGVLKKYSVMLFDAEYFQDFSNAMDGPDWLHAAAEWVREQGGEVQCD